MNKKIIIKSVIAIIAVVNLVLLFGFEYEIFGFRWSEFYSRKNAAEPEAVTQSVGDTTQTAAEASTETTTLVSSEAGTGTSDEMAAAIGSSTAEKAAEINGDKKCRVTSSKNARIRSGPGTEYDRVTSVPRDTILTVLGVEDNGWLHIRTDDGVEGYISGELIEMIDEE